MENRKIYHLLALLTEEDRERFTLYLESPYFNTSKVLSIFWKQWQAKVTGNEEAGKLTIAAFIKGSNLKASRFDKLCSQLYTKTLDFLGQQGFEDSSTLQEILMSKAVLNRDTELETSMVLARKVEKSLDKQLESPEKYLAQLYHAWQIIEARYRSRKPDKETLKDISLMFNYLDGFTASKRLSIGCGAFNLGYIIQQDQEQILDEIKQKIHCSPPKKEGNLLYHIYNLILTLQLEPEAKNRFPELLSLMEEHQGKIEEEVESEIFHFALNHCIRQINIGNETYLGYTLDLYIQLLGNGMILVQEKLTPQQFKNMVVLGCRVDRLDWVEGFMDKYGGQLLNDHEGIALNYNQAVYQFHKRDYQRAIRLLKGIIQESSFDLFYGLDARMYLWKAYYESLGELTAGDIDDMYKLYDSFRLYINRHTKISELHKLQYRNFVRFFKRFLSLVVDQGKDWVNELKLLLQDIQDEKDIANKTWFLEKVTETLEVC